MRRTFINGDIHSKVTMLKKPAPYSRDTSLSVGTGGIFRSLSGFSLEYHLARRLAASTGCVASRSSSSPVSEPDAALEGRSSFLSVPTVFTPPSSSPASPAGGGGAAAMLTHILDGRGLASRRTADSVPLTLPNPLLGYSRRRETGDSRRSGHI